MMTDLTMDQFAIIESENKEFKKTYKSSRR